MLFFNEDFDAKPPTPLKEQWMETLCALQAAAYPKRAEARRKSQAEEWITAALAIAKGKATEDERTAFTEAMDELKGEAASVSTISLIESLDALLGNMPSLLEEVVTLPPHLSAVLQQHLPCLPAIQKAALRDALKYCAPSPEGQLDIPKAREELDRTFMDYHLDDPRGWVRQQLLTAALTDALQQFCFGPTDAFFDKDTCTAMQTYLKLSPEAAFAAMKQAAIGLAQNPPAPDPFAKNLQAFDPLLRAQNAFFSRAMDWFYDGHVEVDPSFMISDVKLRAFEECEKHRVAEALRQATELAEARARVARLEQANHTLQEQIDTLSAQLGQNKAALYAATKGKTPTAETSATDGWVDYVKNTGSENNGPTTPNV